MFRLSNNRNLRILKLGDTFDMYNSFIQDKIEGIKLLQVQFSTMLQKTASLIRLSFFESGIDMLRNKLRHFYDLYFLSNSPACWDFLHTKDFHEHFKRMFEDKSTFEDPEIWLTSSYSNSSILTSFDEICHEVKGTYNTDFSLLVHGDFPEDELNADQFRKIIQILLS